MPLARACLAYPVLVCPLRSTGAAASASAARSPTAAQVRLQSADFCLVKQASELTKFLSGGVVN